MARVETKSNTLLYAGIGGGVFLLLSCCCLGGVGGWFFFLRGGPEKTMIGKWGVDIDAMKKNDPALSKLDEKQWQETKNQLSKVSVEFKSDGTTVAVDSGKTEKGKWKKIETKGDTVTIDVKDDSDNEWQRVDVKVIDSSHLKLSFIKGEKEALYLKRQ